MNFPFFFGGFLRAPSTSTYVPRIMAEQSRIKTLLELRGMRDIQVGLELTHITEDEQMSVDKAPEPRPIEAKRRALEKFVRVAFKFHLPTLLFFFTRLRISLCRFFIYILMMILFFLIQGSAFRQQHGDKVPRLSVEEAVELEQQAHAADLERKRRLLERREKQGLVTVNGGAFTRDEQEARIWAFMYDDPLADFITTYLILMSLSPFRNYKPSKSDVEDDDDDDSEDEDPSTWFHDDQDDGRKGQDIVEPDDEDMSDMIRVDTRRILYNTSPES